MSPVLVKETLLYILLLKFDIAISFVELLNLILLVGKDNEETLNSSQQSPIVQGYGSQAAKGKYEGFGSATVKQSDTLVDQVRKMLDM